jgi:hypothetical protein
MGLECHQQPCIEVMARDETLQAEVRYKIGIVGLEMYIQLVTVRRDLFGK